MKKLLMLCLVAVFLISIGISGHNIEMIDGKHEIYVPSGSYIYDDIIHTGAFDIVRVKSEDYERIRGGLDEIYGEAIEYECDAKEVDKVIKTLKIDVVERCEENDKIVLFGYSPKLKKSIMHKGKRVNIELTFGNNTIQIGTPLIMGGY